MNLGTNIKKIRKQMGMTQAELANAVGVSAPMIVQIEREIKMPSVALCIAIADTLHTTVDALANCPINSN
jgi:DNA-binding XRE family transcriptional regulator